MAVRRFLTDLPPESSSRSSTPAGAITVSVLLHAALVAVLSLAVFRAVAEESYQPPAMPARLVYSVSAGGGASPKGGDKIPAPRQMAQVVAQRPIVAPAARPVPQPSVTPPPQIAPEPLPSLSSLAPSADVGVREAVGALAGLPSGSVGPGSGPLPGDGGQDRGLGGERGNRAGKGTGDEGELPGNGVSWPKLVREIKPNYTPEAMRAQIEGLVELENRRAARWQRRHRQHQAVAGFALRSRFGSDQGRASLAVRSLAPRRQSRRLARRRRTVFHPSLTVPRTATRDPRTAIHRLPLPPVLP